MAPDLAKLVFLAVDPQAQCRFQHRIHLSVASRMRLNSVVALRNRALKQLPALSRSWRSEVMARLDSSFRLPILLDQASPA